MRNLFYFIGGVWLTTLLVVALVLANPPAKNLEVVPTQPLQTPASQITPISDAAEETEIRELVKDFGKKLQLFPFKPRMLHKRYRISTLNLRNQRLLKYG